VLPAACVEVVEREELGCILGAIGLLPLDHLRDSAVELPASLVRESLVRGVADELVPEAECARDVRIPLDELAEPVPGLGRRSDPRVVLEDLDDERPGEGDAQHGCPAEQRAVSGRELVDARRDEHLDRLGELLRLVRRLTDAGQPLEEERIPGCSFHQGPQLLVGQTAAPGRGERERLRIVLRERFQPERQRGERGSAVRGAESTLPGAARRARQPRPSRKLCPQIAQQLGRGVVHPVHVVEDEQRRRVEEVTEQVAHDAVQPSAPERGIERVDLGRRLHLHVEGGGEEWRPWDELLGDGREPLGEGGPVVLAATVQLDVEERAEERTERVVRSRRLVLLAAERDLAHVGAGVAELLCQA